MTDMVESMAYNSNLPRQRAEHVVRQLLPALLYLPHPCGRAEKPFWPIFPLIFVKL